MSRAWKLYPEQQQFCAGATCFIIRIVLILTVLFISNIIYADLLVSCINLVESYS